jgi:hypothetical protein
VEQQSKKCNSSHKKFIIQRLEYLNVSYHICFIFIEFPKNQSRILSNLKRDGTDDEKGSLRASIFISNESVKLAKQGRI